MPTYVTSDTIKTLRERAGLTQRDLAERIGVTDKAVSKWETGRGLPDATLLCPLAEALGVAVFELLSGELVSNANRAANMRRLRFYVCPCCGNVITACGEASISCCGVQLPALEAESAAVLPEACAVEGDEAAHAIEVSYADAELYVTIDHPMTKSHYVSFVAYVTADRVDLRKLYPEQECEARFYYRGTGDVYAFCNRDGLFVRKGVNARRL